MKVKLNIGRNGVSITGVFALDANLSDLQAIEELADKTGAETLLEIAGVEHGVVTSGGQEIWMHVTQIGYDQFQFVRDAVPDEFAELQDALDELGRIMEAPRDIANLLREIDLLGEEYDGYMGE